MSILSGPTPRRPERAPSARKLVILDSDIEPISSPLCLFCAHLHPGELWRCDAFPTPGSIPYAIWSGENTAASGYQHTRPVRGDQGITFQLADGAKAGPAKRA